MKIIETDLLIIGSGLAGSVYAYAALKNGLSCIMLSGEDTIGDCNSNLAQGGIIFDNSGRVDLLKSDIQEASANTSFDPVIDDIIKYGPELIDKILIKDINVDFDKNSNDQLSFTKEGAHSISRIIFSKDKTGEVILCSVHNYLLGQPNLTILNNSIAIDLLTLSHSSQSVQDKYQPLTCFGAYVLDDKTGEVMAIYAKKTVLATGGIGQVYLHSTSYDHAFGHGIAMAYRIGARVIDMEYVQFHPTVFYKKGVSPFLISEAVRGEGGVLVNRLGHPFMDNQHPLKSLAPRDIIARAIHTELIRTDSHCVYLDLSSMTPSFIKDRFPTIYQRCKENEIDISQSPIPVVPAAHFLCGGIHATIDGRTNIRNLNVVGESACTGLHGANRLASTSLLECVTMGYLTAVKDKIDIEQNKFYFPEIDDWECPEEFPDENLIKQDLNLIRSTMWNYVGLIRTTKRLERAEKILRGLQLQINNFYAGYKLTKNLLALRSSIQNALLITYAALKNKNSKGCHFKEQG